MDSSLRGASTAEAWRTWDRSNVAIDEDGVRIERSALPTYEAGHEAAIGGDGSVVDVALAPCGDPYVLTDSGALYRYDPARGRSERLSCLWQATGTPRTICVTHDTVYVAGSAPAAVQAISRYALQTRWIAREGTEDPICLTRAEGAVYLLDGASYDGAASVERVRSGGRIDPVVAGLMSPRDIASGPSGRLWVLDTLVGADPDGEGEPVVRRFDSRDLTPGDPVPATDHVHVVPEAFRTTAENVPVVPSCLAVGPAGDLLVGVSSDWQSNSALLRYRPDEATFEPQPGLSTSADALAAGASTEDPRAYVVDSDGGLHVLDGYYRVSRNDAGRTEAVLRTRFEASDVSVEWHRIHLERQLTGPENEVRVRYATTDAEEPIPARERSWDAPGLESIDGLGPTYAARLRAWGIADLADLAVYSPAAVQAVVSVEEVDVAESTVAEWQSAAAALLNDGTPSTTPVDAVDGIGSVYAARLAAGNIPDLERLVDANTAAIARVVSAGTLRVPLSRTRDWVRTAREQRPDPPSYDVLDWTTITPTSPEDALFDDAVGRYCWIELTLFGTKRRSPTVGACHVEFPRDTYLTELPALYREDADGARFLRRYLSLFERVFDDVEAAIESLPGLLDPDGVPADDLAWLGQFLGMDVDGEWPTPVAREFVDRAPELYRMRGTRRGLRTTLSIYLDHVEPSRRDWGPALEREAAHLDDLVAADHITQREADEAMARLETLADEEPAQTVTIRTWNGLDCADAGPARAFYERLLGCEAGVLLLVHPRVSDADVRVLSRIAASHEPAHVSLRTVGLNRRLQLAGTCEDGEARGYHTYLGVNSTLAERTFALDAAGLGEETVIDSHEPDGQLDLGARLGADARLSR
jgi:phage tail-like protein